MLCLFFVAACSRPVITVEDVIAPPNGESVPITASIETESLLRTRSGVGGVDVLFFADGRPIGRALSDDDGHSRFFCPRDGKNTQIAADAQFDGASLHGTGRVFHWRLDRTIVVVDIDHTVADTHVRSLLFHPLKPDRSDPVPGSREALQQIARDCQIVYITARPRQVLDKTRAWLAAEHYPDGPVLGSPGLIDMIDRTDFKREMFARCRREWPNMLVAIGNSESDRKACRSNRMLALLVTPEKIKTSSRQSIAFRNWRQLLDFYNHNRSLLTDPAALTRAMHDTPDDGTQLIEPKHMEGTR